MKANFSDALNVGARIGINFFVIPPKIWHHAINVELEHGNAYGKGTNVTKNNLMVTGKIALAHLKEFPDYYQRLIRMENTADKYWKNKNKPKPI